MPGQVCVGIGVLVVRPSDNAVLLGRRKGAHGSGTWALPGGWLEKNEEFLACALRELQEETALLPQDVSSGSVLPVVANNVMDKGVHSVTVFVRFDLNSNAASANVRLCEPDKCHEWRWVDTSGALPEPMFPPLQHLISSTYWRDEIAKGSLAQLRQFGKDLPLLLAGAVVGVAAMSLVPRRRR
jgi:ADP-ribose pyrophosphatase YjhB (NUDIX family)